MIKVAIITITYNSSNVIIPFLKCLSESSFKDFKLFIIDNNSVDDTVELIYKIKKIDFLKNRYSGRKTFLGPN